MGVLSGVGHRVMLVVTIWEVGVEYEINIDEESVFFEAEWLTRQELADRIKRKIENQDFSISAAGGALEYLQHALANAQLFQVKLAPSDSERLNQHAERAGIAPGVFLRQALQAYLAAQPPLAQASGEGAEAEPEPEAKAMVTTITTEPVQPGEEAEAVELTARKVEPVEAAVAAAAAVETDPLGSSWFNKR